MLSLGRMMRKNAWLWIPAALLVASCATADQGTDDGTDRADDDLGQITQEPSSSVCTGPLHCYAQIRTDGNGAVKPFATSTGLGPADLASAYKLNTSLKPNATIAIVDAYNYPNAESDLAVYRTKYGLPACTKANGCLTIVNQNGAASPLPANAPANDDWTVEAALDLEPRVGRVSELQDPPRPRRRRSERTASTSRTTRPPRTRASR